MATNYSTNPGTSNWDEENRNKLRDLLAAKANAPAAEAPKTEAPKTEAPKPETPVDTTKKEPTPTIQEMAHKDDFNNMTASFINNQYTDETKANEAELNKLKGTLTTPDEINKQYDEGKALLKRELEMQYGEGREDLSNQMDDAMEEIRKARLLIPAGAGVSADAIGNLGKNIFKVSDAYVKGMKSLQDKMDIARLKGNQELFNQAYNMKNAYVTNMRGILGDIQQTVQARLESNKWERNENLETMNRNLGLMKEYPELNIDPTAELEDVMSAIGTFLKDNPNYNAKLTQVKGVGFGFYDKIKQKFVVVEPESERTKYWINSQGGIFNTKDNTWVVPPAKMNLGKGIIYDPATGKYTNVPGYSSGSGSNVIKPTPSQVEKFNLVGKPLDEAAQIVSDYYKNVSNYESDVSKSLTLTAQEISSYDLTEEDNESKTARSQAINYLRPKISSLYQQARTEYPTLETAQVKEVIKGKLSSIYTNNKMFLNELLKVVDAIIYTPSPNTGPNKTFQEIMLNEQIDNADETTQALIKSIVNLQEKQNEMSEQDEYNAYMEMYNNQEEESDGSTEYNPPPSTEYQEEE